MIIVGPFHLAYSLITRFLVLIVCTENLWKYTSLYVSSSSDSFLKELLILRKDLVNSYQGINLAYVLEVIILYCFSTVCLGLMLNFIFCPTNTNG